MGCLYENNNDGTCTISLGNDDIVDPDNLQQGCDSDGCCCVSEDPNPSDSCDCYESDYTCLDCGVDLNVGECECEDC